MSIWFRCVNYTGFMLIDVSFSFSYVALWGLNVRSQMLRTHDAAALRVAVVALAYHSGCYCCAS